MNSKSVDAVIVGAGFAGLYMLHRLRSTGYRVAGFERGGDVGGTWYWNRYPGARCDVESLDYCYSFDSALQQEWNWTERYATQPEILRYLQHVADRFALRPLIRFDTCIDRAQWNESERRWRVHSDAGDVLDARFLILATGSLSAAKTPDIEGLAAFSGRVIETSSWPQSGVDFSGQRIGVIGTGSSGIQAIPLIAEQAAQLSVFQRTPTFSVPAQNKPFDPAWLAAFKTRYAEHRQRCRETWPGVIFHGSGKTVAELSTQERVQALEKNWAIGGPGFQYSFLDLISNRESNDTAAAFVRDKIRQIVKNPVTAEALCPRDYPLGTKRLAVDTNYYASFNRDNVRLIDLRKTPLRRVVAAGIETSAGITPLDTLVLATGFDAITGSFLKIEVRDAEGRSLREAWAAGPRTYLGLMSAGFPNLFIVAGPGSPSVLSNMVLSIEQHVEWIADCLDALRQDGMTRIEAEESAQDEWVNRVNRTAAGTLYNEANSWFLGANVPGKPRVFMPYVGGVAVYRHLCDKIARNGYTDFKRD